MTSPTKSRSSSYIKQPFKTFQRMDENNLVELAHFSQYQKINEYLKKNPDAQILQMRDSRQYTLLHIGCLNNQTEICELFLKHAMTTCSETEIKEWVNIQTDEGFSALHFSSFKGNTNLIKVLEDYGADIFARNKKGLNVIHIATQGNQPVSIAYFMEKGLSINEKDSNGNTALHWAAHFGLENATYCLTSWGSAINEKELLFGCTALHLAVNSGNMKVVRKLLLKGADPMIKNNEDKLPIDFAIENEFDNIAEILKGRGWLVECLNIRPPLRKKANRLPFIFAIILYLTVGASNFMFLFPFIEDKTNFFLLSTLLILSAIIFIATCVKKPGILNNRKNGDILELLMHHEAHTICTECVILKPERSKHCEACNSCICVYDHHCPWVNNCIGAGNYLFFVMLLNITVITILSLLILACMKFSSSAPPAQGYLEISGYFSDEEFVRKMKDATCIENFVLAAFFLLPLSGLNFMHFQNLVKGRTTSERYTYNNTPHNLSKTQGKTTTLSTEEKYVLMKEASQTSECTENCLSMCFRNAKNPRYSNRAPESFRFPSISDDTDTSKL